MAMNFWIWQQGHRQQKQKQTSGTAQQRNQSTKRKGSLWNGRKYLQSINLIRGWFPKYIGNSHKSITKGQIAQLKDGQRTWTDISPKKRRRRQTGTRKDSSVSLIIREMQIKTTKFYFTAVRMATIKKIRAKKRWWGCGEKGTFMHCW